MAQLANLFQNLLFWGRPRIAKEADDTHHRAEDVAGHHDRAGRENRVQRALAGHCRQPTVDRFADLQPRFTQRLQLFAKGRVNRAAQGREDRDRRFNCLQLQFVFGCFGRGQRFLFGLLLLVTDIVNQHRLFGIDLDQCLPHIVNRLVQLGKLTLAQLFNFIERNADRAVGLDALANFRWQGHGGILLHRLTTIEVFEADVELLPMKPIPGAGHGLIALRCAHKLWDHGLDQVGHHCLHQHGAGAASHAGGRVQPTQANRPGECLPDGFTIGL